MYKSYIPYLQHILDECLYVCSVTQIRAKVIPPNVPEKAYANVEELLSFLATAP